MAAELIAGTLTKTGLTTALKPVADFVRRQWARRGAELSDLGQLAGIDAELDEAIDVLARNTSSLSTYVGQSIKALLSQRPDVFASGDARHFIGDPRVAGLVKAAARKVFADEEVDDERARARVIYGEIFGGDGFFGERIFEDCLAFAVKSLAVRLEPQDRLLIEILSDLRSDAAGHFREISARLEQLQIDLDQRSPLDMASRIFGVPLSGRRLLPRLGLVERVLHSLVNDGEDSATVILVGQGGSGKSTIAAMAARRIEMSDAFPDGIFWLSFGQSPDIAACQAAWLRFASDRPHTFPNAAAATAFLAAFFENRRALLIIDDVWAVSHLQPFQVAGPKCRMLITSRERTLDSYGHVLEMTGLAPEESLALLRMRASRDIEDEQALRDLAEILGHSPLALELAAYQLSIGTPADELLEALADEIELMAELTMPYLQFEADEQTARNQSLDACLNLSVKRLDPGLASFFAALSMIRPGTSFSIELVAHMTGAGKRDSGRAVRRLWSMSLLEEESGSSPPRYRMHSVIRAKAATELAASTGFASRDVVLREGIRAYLRRCNEHMPHDWHLMEDDGHTLRHLVYYLLKADDEASLRSLLTARPAGSVHRRNHWHELRRSRNEEDLFGVEMAQIHDHFAAKRSMALGSFDGLVRSYITRASLADMNRDIDLPLCLALLEAELWNHGQAASHAQRRFAPGDMLSTARRLSEPLRTETLRHAILLLKGQRPNAAIVGELVRIAEVFEGPQRKEIADASAYLAAGSLDLPRKAEDSHALSASRLGFLRSALLMRERLGPKALPIIALQRWVRRFLDQIEAIVPLAVNGRIRFHDRNPDYSFEATVAAVETLLLLASDDALGVGERATATAARILEHELADDQAYAPLRFKLRLQRGDDRSQLREAAIAAMIPGNDAYAAVSRRALWEAESLPAFAAQLAENFAQDTDFIEELRNCDMPNRHAMAFYEKALAPGAEHRDRIIAQVDDAYGGIVAQLMREGSIVPSNQGPLRLTDDRFRVVELFLRAGIGAGAVTPASARRDLLKIRGDFDRLRLIEAILPSLPDLPADEARELCSLLGNPACAAVAWLAAGTRVKPEDRADFLERAISLFADADDPATSLHALSRYIGGYSGEDAVQLARSAAALAAGIGDVNAMRGAFVRASVAMAADARAERVKAPMWNWADTMPTHAAIEPIPAIRALAAIGFWQIDSAPIEDPIPNFVFDHLAEIDPDTTRSRACDQIADLAQEFAMRKMRDHANVLAEAIFDSAAMYP